MPTPDSKSGPVPGGVARAPAIGKARAARGAVAGRAASDGPLTRGGWTPAGTAAERRAVHSKRGTARGQQTRRQIVEAAHKVFERDGYLDVDVEDIVKEAGVARGSFYTYFTSKLDVFSVCCHEVAKSVDQAVQEPPEDERHLDPVEALARSNERYLEAYRRNARIYALLEHLWFIDEDLYQDWLLRRNRQIERVADLIRGWQLRGLADPSVDSDPTAAALLSMISSYCNWLFVNSDGDDIGRASAAINELWIRAVDLRRRPNQRWLEELQKPE